MVLNCKTIFQRASKQASKKNICENRLSLVLSKHSGQRHPYVHGGVRISYMHFSFAWSANLGHTSWHLKEIVTRTGVYRVNALAKLW